MSSHFAGSFRRAQRAQAHSPRCLSSTPLRNSTILHAAISRDATTAVNTTTGKCGRLCIIRRTLAEPFPKSSANSAKIVIIDFESRTLAEPLQNWFCRQMMAQALANVDSVVARCNWVSVKSVTGCRILRKIVTHVTLACEEKPAVSEEQHHRLFLETSMTNHNIC